MLIDNRKNFLNQRVSKGKLTFACSLLTLLTIFNLFSITYANLTMRKVSDPLLESKMIDQTVLIHFTGTLILGTGLTLITFALSNEK